jgi:spore germination protein (amino acid permease)
MIFVAIIGGINIVIMPARLAPISTGGVWVTMFITGAIFILPLLAFCYLGNKFPCESMQQYLPKVIGKVAAKIVLVAYYLYFSFAFIYFSKEFVYMLKIEALPKTPFIVLLALIFITAIYATSKGIKNVGRLMEFWIAISIPLIIIVHIVMFEEGEVINMMPLFEKEQIGNYLKGVRMALSGFFGIEILNFIPFDNKKRKSRKWYLLSALLAGVVLYLIVIYSSYSILTIDDTGNFSNSLFAALRQIRIPALQIFARIDILSIIDWMIVSIGSICLLVYAISSNFFAAFSINPKTWKVVLLCIPVGILSAIVPHDALLDDEVTICLGMTVSAFLPIIIAIIAFFRKVKGEVEYIDE